MSVSILIHHPSYGEMGAHVCITAQSMIRRAAMFVRPLVEREPESPPTKIRGTVQLRVF